MATIKAYTDIEQSKKLVEILPCESADMYYFVADSLEKQEINYAIRCGTPIVKTDIPAWSLTALLSILDFPALTQEKDDEWEVCVCDYNNDGYIEKIASNPVDACYEMILKLHEQNLL